KTSSAIRSAWAGSSTGSPLREAASISTSASRAARVTSPRESASSLETGRTWYHTYFTTGRGLEVLNPTYGILDLVPKGRDEDGLEWPMAWVKRHDEYVPQPRRA